MKSKDQKFISINTDTVAGDALLKAVSSHFEESIPGYDDHSAGELENIVERYDVRTPPEQIVDYILQKRRDRAKLMGVTDGAFRAWQRENGFRILTDDDCLYEYLRGKHRHSPKSKLWMERHWKFSHWLMDDLKRIGHYTRGPRPPEN